MRVLSLTTLVFAATATLVAADGSRSGSFKSPHDHGSAAGSHGGGTVARPPRPVEHRSNGSDSGSWAGDVPHRRWNGSGSGGEHRPKKPRACGPPPPPTASVDGSGSGWNHTARGDAKRARGHRQANGSHGGELFDCGDFNASSGSDDEAIREPRGARATPVPAPTSGAASSWAVSLVAAMATTCAAFAALA
ncbi:hypothetical protein P43SY_003653 [Pythium insidiosum]|uniref:Uncharacterized protein n=1 Tax=Pythium insidiosum TaxID=114742 RepID=A0AAD5LD87_PYTIN|nr:hypothetical protein P43SY_003653 [Pythium insidiosum]